MANPTSIAVKDATGSTQQVSTLDALVGPLASVSSAALEVGHILNAAACSLFGFQVNTTTVSGWVMLFDAATVPADGTVAPKKWWQLGPNQTLGVEFLPALAMTTGAVVAFSTTGPFTKTGSATATFSGESR